MLFKGFYLERDDGVGTSKPCMKDYDAIAIPVFHSRREAWMFLRGWSKGLTTKELKRKGYRCVKVNVFSHGLLKSYGGHTADCNYCSGKFAGWPARECDCGWAEVEKVVRNV